MPEPAYRAYVVNESKYETEPVRVVTVNKPNSLVNQMEELLKILLTMLTPAIPTPVKTPETSPSRNDASNVFRGTAVVTTKAWISTGTTAGGPTNLARNEVFFMWENGSRRKSLSNIGCDFPIYITGLEG